MEFTTRKIKLSDSIEVYSMYKKLYDYLFEKGFMLKLNKKKVIIDLIIRTLDLEYEHIYIAESNGKIAGFIYFTISDVNNKFVSPYGGNIGNLIELYIKDEYRGKNVGKVLLDVSDQFFKKHKAKIVQVSTTAKNTRAIEFYKKQGFFEDYITFSRID